MKKFSKAGLLIVTLVIPALIFTFLRFFATNHYSLPYYHPLVDSTGEIIISGQDTVFYKVRSPKLTVSGKDSVDATKFEGELTVINYLPMSCDDTCRLVLNQLERIYGLRTRIADLHLLTIAEKLPMTDGTYPAVMGTKGWNIGIVAPEDKDPILNIDFKFYTKVPKSKTNSIETKLILIDRAGYIRGYYIGSDKEEIDRLMAEIKILDYEENNKE